MANATPPSADFYTFVKDVRNFGGGSALGYKYDPANVGQNPNDTTKTELFQGEMVAWSNSSTTPSLIRWVRDGSAGKFVGISRESATGVKRLGNQAALTPTELSVFTTGVHNLRSNSGETYNEGDVVYMNSTFTDQITKTAGGGTAIGRVFLPNSPAIVGDGSVRVPVIIDEYSNYAGQ